MPLELDRPREHIVYVKYTRLHCVCACTQNVTFSYSRRYNLNNKAYLSRERYRQPPQVYTSTLHIKSYFVHLGLQTCLFVGLYWNASLIIDNSVVDKLQGAIQPQIKRPLYQTFCCYLLWSKQRHGKSSVAKQHVARSSRIFLHISLFFKVIIL